MDWDDYADGWDQDEAVRRYASAAFDALGDLFPRGLAGLRIWDFGCGTGQLSVRLAEAGAQVWATDASPKMIAVLERKIAAARLGDLVAEVGSLEGVPAERRFDLVVASSVLAFLPDPTEALRVFAAHLAPGGLVVHWDWARDDADEEPFGFTPAEVRAGLEAAGLEVVEVGVGFSVPLGAETMAPLVGVGRRG